MRSHRVVPAILKTLTAALLMGASLVWLGEMLAGLGAEWGFWGRTVRLGLAIAAGTVVYFVTCALLRVEEVHYLFRKAR